MKRCAATPIKRVRVTAAHLAVARDAAKKDYSPKWDNIDSLTSEEFSQAFHYAMQYYSLQLSTKDLKTKVIQWMQREGCDVSLISEFKYTADWRCSSTMGAIAACLLKGMPQQCDDFNNGRDNKDWLLHQVANAIDQGKHDYSSDTKVVVPLDIHGRLMDTAKKMVQELDEAIDQWSRDPKSIDLLSINPLVIFQTQGTKAAHATIIKGFYSDTATEVSEVITGTADEQLREGYSTRTTTDLKALYAFYAAIMSACDMLAEIAKVERKPRIKKPVQKETLVKSLKYKKTDDGLKLVSISPILIIGAKELWCYDTKTRKLGKYIAKDESGLGVKGSTITGFDETHSIQKTLRKPADQLATFKSLGKVPLQKFLDDIITVDIKLCGRINENIILLKI